MQQQGCGVTEQMHHAACNAPAEATRAMHFDLSLVKPSRHSRQLTRSAGLRARAARLSCAHGYVGRERHAHEDQLGEAQASHLEQAAKGR